MTREIPEVPIRSFHRDEEGQWVATLECGHLQHVRHRPPMETRAWVLSEEGRRGHIGAPLACRACRMPRIPGAAQEYKRSSIFDAATVPAGLLQRHTLKAGVWAEIVVVEGRVLYVIEDEDDASFVLHPGLAGWVAPQAPHHVELLHGARFFVRFLRIATPGA